MPCFIELTESVEGAKIFVNMDIVSEMNTFKGLTYLYFSYSMESDYVSTKVKETPQEIIAKIDLKKQEC